MKISPPWFLTLVILAASCAVPAKVDKPREQMTQWERDSTIAESGLIGSGVVKKALSVTAAEDKRAAQYDSASQ